MDPIQEELVEWISPKKVLKSETTMTIGTAMGDSSKGLVPVELDASVISDDDYDYSEQTTTTEIPTTAYCKEGDQVIISLFGVEGIKTPTVIGVSGGGDRMQEEIESGGGGGAFDDFIFADDIDEQSYPRRAGGIFLTTIANNTSSNVGTGFHLDEYGLDANCGSEELLKINPNVQNYTERGDGAYIYGARVYGKKILFDCDMAHSGTPRTSGAMLLSEQLTWNKFSGLEFHLSVPGCLYNSTSSQEVPTAFDVLVQYPFRLTYNGAFEGVPDGYIVLSASVPDQHTSGDTTYTEKHIMLKSVLNNQAINIEQNPDTIGVLGIYGII